MSITLVKDSENIIVDGKALYDVVGELCAVADSHLRRSEYFSQCLEIIANFFEAKNGILNVRNGARTLERSFEQQVGALEPWHEDLDSLILRVQSNESALVQKYLTHSGRVAANIVAAPLLSKAGKPFGAIGLVIPANRFANSRTKLALLSQLLNLIVVGTPSEENQPKESSEKTLQSVVRAADYQSIQRLCFAIVNSLCGKLGCEQVAIGLATKNDVRLIAVSGLSDVPKSTPGMQAVYQAMATCLDRNDTCVYQEEGRLVDQCESSTCKIHQLWFKIAGGSCVATVPLQIDGHCVAVLALRKKSQSPFTPEDLKRARIMGESFAPALPLVDKASRSIVSHCADSFAAFIQKWYGWHGLGRKFAAAAILIFLLWSIFGTVNHEVIAPCKIAARNVITVASPYDGMIERVHIEPGQRVNKGQVLVSFDQSDLLADRKRLMTEIASTKVEMNSLLQKRVPEDAFLLQSKVSVLEAELELVDQKTEAVGNRISDRWNCFTIGNTSSSWTICRSR